MKNNSSPSDDVSLTQKLYDISKDLVANYDTKIKEDILETDNDYHTALQIFTQFCEEIDLQEDSQFCLSALTEFLQATCFYEPCKSIVNKIHETSQRLHYECDDFWQ